MERKLYRLVLDYDELPREEVERDARRLDELFNLGGFEIRESEHGGIHVVFPHAVFESFEEVYRIAEMSKCDKEWLRYCRMKGALSLARKGSYVKLVRLRSGGWADRESIRRGRRLMRRRGFKEYPIWLVIYPRDEIDEKRIKGILDSFEDCVYREEMTIDLKRRFIVGCVDKYQALRRVKWLQNVEPKIEFTYEVKWAEINVNIPRDLLSSPRLSS